MQKFAYVPSASSSSSTKKTKEDTTTKASPNTSSRRRGSTAKVKEEDASVERSTARRGRPLSTERTIPTTGALPSPTSTTTTIPSKRSKKDTKETVKLEYDNALSLGVPNVVEAVSLTTTNTKKSTASRKSASTAVSTVVSSSTSSFTVPNGTTNSAPLAATLESFNHSLVRPNQSALSSSISSSSLALPSSPVRPTKSSSSSTTTVALSSSSTASFPEPQQPPNSPSRGYGTPRKPHPKWEEQLHNILTMRSKKTAPVDSMGCERCADPKAEPRIQRFQTLLSLLLSSQTKDPITYAATQRLIEYGCTPEKLMHTDTAVIEKLIYPAGFYRNKAEYIKSVAETCVKEYGGDIPQDIPSLCALRGIGPKMAFIAMNAAWGKPVGIGVDTHVHRISNTLGWVKTSSPEQTREHLQSWLPREYWSGLNVALVGFGQEICLPRGPKCEECLNRYICPGSQAKGGKKQWLMENSKGDDEEVEDDGEISSKKHTTTDW